MDFEIEEWSPAESSILARMSAAELEARNSASGACQRGMHRKCKQVKRKCSCNCHLQVVFKKYKDIPMGYYTNARTHPRKSKREPE